MHRNLIVDLNNLAFGLRHAVLGRPKSHSQKEDMAMEYLLLKMIKTVFSNVRKFSCSGVVIACDSKNVWRKDIYPLYKEGKSDYEDVYHDDVIVAANMFKDFFTNQTACYVLEVPRTEADDIIAVWCQESRGVENVILSSDKDFIQLIDERTSLYSIQQKKFRTIPEDSSVEYELFEKCIRGDMGNDNITSAYPRIRKTKIIEAYNNDYELLNTINHILPSGERVGDLFERNLKLIDLTQQPAEIREEIKTSINNYRHGMFTELGALKAIYDMGIRNQNDLFEGYTRPYEQPPKLKQED